MAEPLLQVKNLKVNFLVGKEKVNAVRDINFTVEKGQTLAIVGESGCGKSVTATAIMRLLPKTTSEIDPDTSIRLNGRELVTLSDNEFREVRGKDISMIFQEPMTSLNPVHTIGKQMIEMVQAHRKISKNEAFEVCVEMLEKVGIPAARQRMKEYPHNLSGGMRQRVMIAMALSCRPALLIADEPTTALDVTIQAQILELMNSLKNEMGTSIILITHDMGVVAEASDHVMVMYAGEMVEYDSVEEVFTNPLHPYTIGLLNSIPRLDKDYTRLATIDGTVPTLQNMPDGCRFADRCKACTQQCISSAPPVRRVGKSHLVRCWNVAQQEEE